MTTTDTPVALTGWNGDYQDGVLHQYILGNGYRAYNPVLQRFTAPDSLSPFGAGGINPYAYCAGDPINHTDPSGHGPVERHHRRHKRRASVGSGARELGETLSSSSSKESKEEPLQAREARRGADQGKDGERAGPSHAGPVQDTAVSSTGDGPSATPGSRWEPDWKPEDDGELRALLGNGFDLRAPPRPGYNPFMEVNENVRALFYDATAHDARYSPRMLHPRRSGSDRVTSAFDRVGRHWVLPDLDDHEGGALFDVIQVWGTYSTGEFTISDAVIPAYRHSVGPLNQFGYTRMRHHDMTHTWVDAVVDPHGSRRAYVYYSRPFAR